MNTRVVIARRSRSNPSFAKLKLPAYFKAPDVRTSGALRLLKSLHYVKDRLLRLRLAMT